VVPESQLQVSIHTANVQGGGGRIHTATGSVRKDTVYAHRWKEGAEDPVECGGVEACDKRQRSTSSFFSAPQKFVTLVIRSDVRFEEPPL
jgi:hypothetical protein